MGVDHARPRAVAKSRTIESDNAVLPSSEIDQTIAQLGLAPRHGGARSVRRPMWLDTNSRAQWGAGSPQLNRATSNGREDNGRPPIRRPGRIYP
jgi:hypothetical protein